MCLLGAHVKSLQSNIELRLHPEATLEKSSKDQITTALLVLISTSASIQFPLKCLQPKKQPADGKCAAMRGESQLKVAG